MNKSDLQFLQSTLIMERLFGNSLLRKNAQEGEEDGGAFAKIKNEVLHAIDFNKDHPVESILAFIGPGLLAILGFKKIAAAVALSEALGFNWTHFFTSIREKLEPLLTGMHEEGKPGSSAEVHSIVQGAGEEAFQGQVDVDKLEKAVETYSSLNNMLYIQKVAQRYKKDPSIMQGIEKLLSGVGGNRMRKGMLGFIVRVVAWLVTAVVIAAGFKLVGNGVSKLLGINKDKKEEENSDAPKTDSTDSTDAGKDKTISDTHPSDKNLKLTLNHNADPELFTTTYNDDKHVWILNSISIANIHSVLIKWAQTLYPQLSDERAFDASSSFNRTLRMFTDRNKAAGQLEVVGVPQPFKSIKEIVDSFAADVASHMANSTDSTGLTYA